MDEDQNNKSTSKKTRKNIGGFLIGAVTAFAILSILYFLSDYLGAIIGVVLGIIIAILFLVIALVLLIYFFRAELARYLLGEDVDINSFKQTLRSITDVAVERYIETTPFMLSEYDRGQIRRFAPQVLFTIGWGYVKSKSLSIIVSLLIGVFGIIGTYLIIEQNNLLELQNKEIVKQIDIEQSNSEKENIALVMSLLARVDQELKDNDRSLSDDLVNDIINMTYYLKPYSIYNREERILERRIYCPEKGFLLFTLLSKKLDQTTYDSIYSKAEFAYSDLRGLNLEGAYLSGINMKHANLANANLKNVNLKKADLSYINMYGTTFDEVDLDFSTMEEGGIIKSIFKNSSCKRMNFHNAKIDSSYFFDIKFMASDFSTSSIQTSRFHESDLFGAYFGEAQIINSRFDQSDLTATFINNIYILNSVLMDTPWDEVDATGAIFKMCNLSYSTFKKADFSHAVIETSNASFANFSEADLYRSRLDDSDFTNTIFIDAKHIEHEQFAAVHSLKSSVGLPSGVKQSLKRSHPILFK